MKKEDVLHAVLAAVETEVKNLAANAEGAHAVSVEAPSAMQSHSDTTKFQMKALEENAKRIMLEREVLVRDLRKFVAHPVVQDEVGVGLCVTVSDGAKTSRYVLLEGGAGITAEVGGERWTVVTPASPLGKALIGRRKGDAFIFFAGGKERELRIAETM